MVIGTEDLEFKECEQKRGYRHFREEHRKKTYNDLCLFQTWESYGAVDKQVFAIKKMRGHM